MAHSYYSCLSFWPESSLVPPVKMTDKYNSYVPGDRKILLIIKMSYDRAHTYQTVVIMKVAIMVLPYTTAHMRGMQASSSKLDSQAIWWLSYIRLASRFATRANTLKTLLHHNRKTGWVDQILLNTKTTMINNDPYLPTYPSSHTHRQTRPQHIDTLGLKKAGSLWNFHLCIAPHPRQPYLTHLCPKHKGSN